MASKTILLLNTMESRQLKKDGVLTVERNGLRITLDYDKKREEEERAQIIGVENVGVKWCDPFAENYAVRLTQAESKEYHTNGKVIIERTDNTFILENGICVPMLTFKKVYVR